MAGCFAWLVVLTAPLAVAKEAVDTITATVKVDLQRAERPIDPWFMGMGVHPGERSTLTGEDYKAYGATLSETTERLGKTFTREVAPHSAQMISFKVPPR